MQTVKVQESKIFTLSNGETTYNHPNKKSLFEDVEFLKGMIKRLDYRLNNEELTQKDFVDASFRFHWAKEQFENTKLLAFEKFGINI